MVQRNEIVKYLNEVFAEVSFPDYSYNGLQFEGSSTVKKIAAGVDGTNEFFAEAIKQGADFALVHHGLFWKGAEWTRLDRINQMLFKTLLSGNLNLFAMHLPLDAHPQFGNNAIIAKLLKAEVFAPFGGSRGNAVGVLARLKSPVSLAELNKRIEKEIGPIATQLDFGKKKVQTLGILSGGGWSSVNDPLVYDGEVDVILTGEIVHQAVASCRDRKINMISAGHYATEVFGARELGRHIAEKFGLGFTFIDLPTGL
ncbi:MAG: Nif3-like dinuclear metal center hexameric protein [Candidatus Riflebacteria bacterium]|nr:Nif3-like dinuclear metal center hexameric protein [Candidatus Riflebacteria bacterium]